MVGNAIHPDELINLETDPKSLRVELTTSSPAQIVGLQHASTGSWRRAARLFGSGYFLM